MDALIVGGKEMTKRNFTFEEYQFSAKRTANPHENAILNYGLGIAGEAGEVADIIKKVSFHGHEMNKDDLKKELGDVLWYLSNIADLSGITLEDVAVSNCIKLQHRYPKGFDKERSIYRKVEDEC